MHLVGQVFRGRLTSADASGGASVPLFNPDGSALTQGSTQAVNLTDIVISSAVAMTVTIGFDTLSSGKITAKVILTATNPTVIIDMTTPSISPTGKGILVQSSVAGQLDVLCSGILA